jgi:hypothetical protein
MDQVFDGDDHPIRVATLEANGRLSVRYRFLNSTAYE